jgi:transporter family protein
MNWLFWALLSAFFAAITTVLAKVGVANVNSNLAIAIRTSVVVVFSWALVTALSKTNDLQLNNISGRAWLFLCLSGLATALSWLCYFRALQLGDASKVAPIDKLSVIFVMIIAAVCLREQVSWHQWLGGVLIVVGAIVLVAQWWKMAAIQMVRPLESIAETQPQLQPDALRLSAIFSQWYSTKVDCASFPLRTETTK